MRIVLLLLAAAVGLTGCRKLATHTSSSTAVTTPDTLIPGTFVTTAGEYRGHEGRFTRIIKLTDHGTSIAWSIATEKGTSGDAADHQESTSALVLAKPADPWFIYVESPARLWLCDGHANVYACFVSASGANDYHQLANSGHRTTKEIPLPAPVYQRLPESLRALFPIPAEEAKRPTF